MLDDGTLAFEETKGREETPKRRRIELRPELRAVIDATRDAWEGKTFLKTEGTGIAFTPDNFTYHFKEWTKAAGIPQVSPHSVRKFVATQAGLGGAGDLTIAGLLGHTSTKNVGVYVKEVRKDELFDGGIAAVLLATTRKTKGQPGWSIDPIPHDRVRSCLFAATCMRRPLITINRKRGLEMSSWNRQARSGASRQVDVCRRRRRRAVVR